MIQNQIKTNKEVPSKFSGIPGQTMGKKRKSRSASEYKNSLKEKQKMRELYCLSEKQFKRYVNETLSMTKAENLEDELIKRLEKRLDSVVLRLGLAKSQRQARQLVSHGYFLVNGRSVNIPSFQVNKGDSITIKESKKKKLIFNDLSVTLKKIQTPAWLSVDSEKLEGKIIRDPNFKEVNSPIEISLIFEFYSR